MIAPPMIARFLAGCRGQALEAGNRYAREARVESFVGSAGSVTTVVRGLSGDHEVALWAEQGRLAHRCSCPSWRDPCKHEVAAALVLRQWLRRDPQDEEGEEDAEHIDIGEGLTVVDPGAARERAIEERRTAARREKLAVRLAEPPVLRVGSASGFEYRVMLRGGPEGPHGCDCPDFEANRLHTCKHVERARLYLASRARRLPAEHRAAARRPRIYLHFGEHVEPRMLGGDGKALRPIAGDPRVTLAWLQKRASSVEPDALAWLEARVRRRPELPEGDLRPYAPRLPMAPYAYQWEGAQFLARSGRALLADEMGLGKTVQAILGAVLLRAAAEPVKHVTIVCPASLRGGWQEEIRRWLGEEARLLEGPSGERERIIRSRPPWLITHFEQVARDHWAHRASPPDLLIVDEAQRAKGLTTRTARTLKRIEARHVFALTGTPLENRLEEAYAIAQLIDQRLLPPLWQLDRDHFVREGGRRVVMYRNLDALRSSLAPAFLRRRKEDVALELPERLRSERFVPLHPAVLSTYGDVMDQVAKIARKHPLLPADIDRMLRLLVIARRCCNGPHLLGKPFPDDEVPKLAELEQALKELCLGEGRKAVVFSEWTDMTGRVEDMARRLRLPVFHLRGDVPLKRRPQLIRGFSETSGPAVFVSTDAGGLGLNLQAADVLVNLDLPWNPARLEQRIARVHRIGSKRSVQILLIVAGASVEERILRQHETKRNVLASVWAADGEDRIAAPGGSGALREVFAALLATAGPADSDPAGELARVAEPERPELEPATLARAVAGVAPSLPPEHRQSLAAVFRALAGALDGAA